MFKVLAFLGKLVLRFFVWIFSLLEKGSNENDEERWNRRF